MGPSLLGSPTTSDLLDESLLMTSMGSYTIHVLIRHSCPQSRSPRSMKKGGLLHQRWLMLKSLTLAAIKIHYTRILVKNSGKSRRRGVKDWWHRLKTRHRLMVLGPKEHLKVTSQMTDNDFPSINLLVEMEEARLLLHRKTIALDPGRDITVTV